MEGSKTDTQLKAALQDSAIRFAKTNNFSVTEGVESEILFEKVEQAFCRDCYDAILQNEAWLKRIQKPHPRFTGVYDVQSSNSRDALLMNLFCHPQFGESDAIAEVLGFHPTNPAFADRAFTPTNGGSECLTHIDLAVGDSYIVTSLAEAGFNDGPFRDPENYQRCDPANYQRFCELFDVEQIEIQGDRYKNAQIFRTVLAAIQNGKRHALLCDERRQDLVGEYLKATKCLKDATHRDECRVIYWQELKQACGWGHASFLSQRYGFR